ncbi:hypothetical protein QVD17_10803 [Tagetes erecta]|uniref:Uncharacterized protein n=1 Tax=Tagetes erecta TaxID=13708 RepID=A0AAD8LA31_TARER|nr:hypothetical protein QVD17_10803 [Tagetes erecta]
MKVGSTGGDKQQDDGGCCIFLTGASTCGDERQDIFIYNLETLDDHINRFDTDPKILVELDKRVKSDKQTQSIWFHELRDTWTNPETPVDAFELVSCVFHSLYNGLPPPLEFQGFLKHYGIPTYCDVGVSDFTVGDIPTYNLEVLSDHINRFDTEPEVLHELDNRVSEDGEGLDFWFVGLRKAWTNPKTPEDASRLVRDVFYKLYKGCPSIFNLQGFLEHYGLPTYWELPEEKKWGF